MIVKADNDILQTNIRWTFGFTCRTFTQPLLSNIINQGRLV